METVIYTLGQYYGLDWVSVVFGLIGLYLVTEKNRIGFLFTVISVVLAAVVAMYAGAYGFILANIVTAILAIRGYIKWNN